MGIELLTILDCPHRSRTLERLRDALARLGRADVAISERRVADVADASPFGMRGSPTILVDGRDLFDGGATEASLSCRLYGCDAGLDGAPSVDARVDALQ